MASRPLDTPVSTFVVRLWPAWSEQGPAWRGQVVHLQTGKALGFQDPAAVLVFIGQIVDLGMDDPHSAPQQSRGG
jgi:hypothetical protein